MITVVWNGESRLAAKVARLPAAVAEALKAVNGQNAEEFAQRVRAVIPVDDAASVHLAETVRTEPGKSPLARRAVVGGPEAPYPAHLEYGHIGPGGVHVAPRPFWWPTWREGKRRFKGRASRAASKAIKLVAATHG